MKPATQLKNLLNALLGLTLYLAHPAWAATDAAYVLAISPPPAITTMSFNEARAIFSMRVRTWPDGTPISVFVLPDDNYAHRKFIRSQLKLLPHQLKRNWDRMVYTGIGKAPTTLSNETEMLKKLQEVPGSVGYLTRNRIDQAGDAFHAVTLH